MATFKELNLSEEILKAVEDLGFEELTPIQEAAIPVVLAAEDIIGQAQTGTGKTAAFTIPFLEKITSAPVVQVLVLTPTRELCLQISEEVGKLAKYKKVSAVPIYGGQDINRQIKLLKRRPQIIIATPGRLLDHLRRKTIRLNSLIITVLDEADEMLNMGFLEDIEKILATCPEERQTLMFSATMRPEIEKIADNFMQKPKKIKVKTNELTVPKVEQYYYEVKERNKLDALCRLLDLNSPDLALVFGRTKRRVDELADALQKRGYLVEGIHGDLNQRQRNYVMDKFKKGEIDILVATDVAARGIDITGVSHVYNFDIPQDVDSYVHRIGRTGRAGREGIAATFVEPREIMHLKTIEQGIKRKLQRKRLPSLAEVDKERQKSLINKITEVIEDGKLDQFKFSAEELINEFDSVTALAAALKLISGRETNDEKIVLTEEKPFFKKRDKKVKKPYNRKRNKFPKFEKKIEKLDRNISNR